MPAKAEFGLERVGVGGSPVPESADLRRTLGGYVIDAVPAYYELVPLARDRLAEIVGDSIGQQGSEFEQAVIVSRDGKPVGLVTWLEADCLGSAQRSAAVGMMRHLDRQDSAAFLQAVGTYSKQVEPVDGSGLYLSRITIDGAARGLGLGRAAVEQVIDAAEGRDVWLHVASENERAIALYRALGFEFLSSEGFESRAMRRPAQIR